MRPSVRSKDFKFNRALAVIWSGALLVSLWHGLEYALRFCWVSVLGFTFGLAIGFLWLVVGYIMQPSFEAALAIPFFGNYLLWGAATRREHDAGYPLRVALLRGRISLAGRL